MSFGGSVQSMITSLKNNSRSKRKSYFDKGGLYSKQSRKGSFFKKKATPEQLANIKEKMLSQRRDNRTKTLMIIGFGIFILVVLLWFINTFSYEMIKEIFS
jgi:hypothetical protein